MEEEIQERDSEKFTNEDKKKMFLSTQTYEGIIITSKSMIDCVKYLLQNGVNYVLTERFCQDDLENYFGKQRAIGRRKDNPRLVDVGYNDNTIKTQFSVQPIAGNVRSNEDSNKICNEPLKKRKRPEKKLI